MKLLRPTLLTLACLIGQPVIANDLPSLGDSSSGIVSPEQEHQLGRAWLSLLRGQVPQLSDPLLKDYLERSVYRLAETSQLQDRRLEFVLLDSPQLNAFAAPGGIIGVNGGLFLHAQTEAEYASVLAHELAHLSQRHFARGLEAQKRMQLPLMAAMLAGVVAAAAGAGDAGIAAIISTQAAAIQSQRRFSRQNEQEADRIGIINLERAGYDPRAMPEMFGRLMRQYRYDQKPPEFLLTHPVTESRIADTKNRAEQYPDTGVEDSLRYQLLRARVELKFESTPGVSAKRFRAMLADEASGYTSFVSTDNVEISDPDAQIPVPLRMPQMPTYHLKRPDGSGITLVNIGVGPSNAKTATDHIAVLRPHAWLMVGHCAGLRNSQSLGDFVLAHGYLREDKVLDDDLPVWVPIPALAEIQVALEDAVAAETQLSGYDLKRIMRTGTVATVDNRNWELREHTGPVQRLSQSRAVALDMESATIAANGFRFRVPYGTLLCVSDKPLHGELKLPGMASDFYKTQVARHLRIGIRAMESLRDMPLERIHSRKLRSFEETAFL